MQINMYVKASAINLLFLAAGILIGPSVTRTENLFVRSVQAQSKKGIEVPAKADPAPSTPKECEGFECVSPSISSGTAAFHTLIAHRIASDRLMVNGYEPLKLTDGIIGVLVSKNILTSADAQRIIAGAKADKPLRLQPAK